MYNVIKFKKLILIIRLSLTFAFLYDEIARTGEDKFCMAL
jgi:hypothetical protein